MLALLSLTALAASDKHYFLPPPAGKTGPEISLIFIQGASCPPDGYRPLGAAIQAASPFPVWFGVPEFLDDTPQPLQFKDKLKQLNDEMTTAGMKANKSVVMAHSLGGVMTQTYATGNKGAVDAYVLYGATVLRSNRDKDLGAPVLTLDGDLDGLLRVTRQAEAWWHQHKTPTQPVVLLPGLNHWSISSGDPPSNVKKYDIPAEVAEDAAHKAISSALVDWLLTLFGSGDAKAAADKAMGARLASTATMVAPLISGLQMEGSPHLQTSCNSDYPTNPTCNYPM